MLRKLLVITIFLGLIWAGLDYTFYTGAYEIKWGTAPAGGLWQVIGTMMLEDVLKKDPQLKGSTVPMGGSANVMGVSEGKLNIAFSFTDVTHDAMAGREFFKAKITNVRQLACLFPEPTQFVVWADSNIKEIHDLRGKRISPGPKGSAVELVTRRILSAYGMSYKDFSQVNMGSFSDAAQQMADGHLDAILYGAMVYPAPTFVDLSSRKDLRLLSLSDEVIKKLVITYKGLEPYTLPPNSYRGVTYPVKGVASLVNIIVREDMPSEVAYLITKTVAENFERYRGNVKAMQLGSVKEMPKDVGIPFHPGALRYYKEKGWIK